MSSILLIFLTSPLDAARVGPRLDPVAAAHVIQGWVQEDHERRRRTENELRELRARFEDERDRRVRAETRLEAARSDRTAQAMMALVGGASLGFGFTMLYEHAWGLEAIGVVGGLVVGGAGFLLADLRGKRGGAHGE